MRKYLNLKNVFSLSLFMLSLSALQANEGRPGAILYIGDSISDGAFGATLDEGLRKLSSQTFSIASCGSSPTNWLRKSGYASTPCGYWEKTPRGEIRTISHQTPSIETKLEGIKPRATIVQLGTNIAVDNPELQRPAVRNLLKAIRASDSECFWISPPQANSSIVTAKKLKATREMIREESNQSGQECAVVDVLERAPVADGPDGIHPSPTLARKWAIAVSEKLIAPLKKTLSAGRPNHSVNFSDVPVLEPPDAAVGK